MDRVNGANTVDIGDGRRGFRSQNASAGIAGTEVTDKILNDLQEEICAVIEKSGFELNSGNQQQLWEALQAMIAPGFGNRTPWLPVLSVTTTAPPVGPAIGDAYIVPAGATGAWAGHDQKLAEWSGSAWRLSAPKNGHGVSTPNGRVYERIGGVYVEKIALDSQSGKWQFAVAGGTANALTATLDPAPSALVAGMMLILKLTATNNGDVTLNVSGLGPKSVTFRGGGPIPQYRFTKDQLVSLIYDGTTWVLVGDEIVPSISPIVYVRPDGNDNNSGRANTAAEALKTISAAIKALKRYVLSDAEGVIQLGSPGNYAAPGSVSVNGTISIVGNPAAIEGYIIENSSGDSNLVNVAAGTVNLIGVKLRNVSSASAVLGGVSGGRAKTENTVLESTISSALIASVAYGGAITLNNNTIIRGSALSALRAATGGQILVGGTITFESAVYSDATAYASTGGGIFASTSGAAAGSATGKRYSAITNAVITVAGGGVNFFPGTVAGTTANGGYYG